MNPKWHICDLCKDKHRADTEVWCMHTRSSEFKWHHILDKQPENKSIIIEVDEPYEIYKGKFKNHYSIGMRQFYLLGDWDDYEKSRKESGLNPSNWWWMYAEDFPFPKDIK